MSDKNDESTSAGSSPTTTTAPTMNKQLIRAAVLIAVLAASAYWTKVNIARNEADDDAIRSEAQQQHHLWVVLHLLAFSSWFGCSIWVSFIAGIIMFQNLPRHTFGRLQSKLFPAYFRFSSLCIVGAIYAAGKISSIGYENSQSLVIILVTILLNLFYFEPQTTKVMYERHVVERKLGTGHEIGVLKPADPKKANDPELKALSKKFGMLHGISTLLNLGALAAGCYWLNYFCTQLVVVVKA